MGQGLGQTARQFFHRLAHGGALVGGERVQLKEFEQQQAVQRYGQQLRKTGLGAVVQGFIAAGKQRLDRR